MTDKEKIEEAASEYSDLPYVYGDEAFEEGVKWRDDNPSPKVLALVDALKHYEKRDWGESNIATQALAAWSEQFKNLEAYRPQGASHD